MEYAHIEGEVPPSVGHKCNHHMVSESCLALVMVDHKCTYEKAFSLRCASTPWENMEYTFMT